MPVVSAVLHVNPGKMAEVRAALEGNPRLTLGPSVDDRLPVVGDTENRYEDKLLWRELEHHPEIRFFELTFADFSDIHQEGVQ